MRIPIALAGLTLITSACFSPSFSEGVPCSVDRECPEGQVCAEDDRCYTPGNEPDPETDGGVVETCDDGAVECVDGQRTACEAGVERTETCALGCADDGQSCIRIDPSNGVAVDLEAAFDADDVVLTDNAFINTDTGEIRNGDGTLVVAPFRSVSAPEGGVPLGVFAFRSLILGNVAVVGEAGLVLVVANDIEIEGTVDLSATNGPGPGARGACGGGAGRRQPGDTAFASGGGTGGTIRGFATAADGGNGGCVTVNGSCTLAQHSQIVPATSVELIPLMGGCDGGAFPSPNRQGGGGGAVQIVSNLEIRFGPSGAILAGGAGGFRDDGEDEDGFTGSGGAGGGSGGGVLLEAPSVVLVDSSGIAANGGGGGSYLAAGADANVLTSNPAQGASGNVAKGEGGNGATQTTEAGDGGDRESGAGNGDPDTAAAGGGGGGGLGRVRINTIGGTFDPPAGAILSPTPSVGTLVAQ